VKIALVSSLLLALCGFSAVAEMKPPRISFAQVDWPAAISTLAGVDAQQPVAMAAATLVRINAAVAQRIAGVAGSPVPVLLPFDTAALLQDQAAGATVEDDERYFFGFHAAKFFYSGPAGYDAAFAIRFIDESQNSKKQFTDPIEVHISASTLLYELEWPAEAGGKPVPALEEEFPGIRRLMHEHHLRYTFARFGVPYVVSIGCFEASISRYKMPTCRTADQVALRFLRALRVVGGMPRRQHITKPLPIERPTQLSEVFTYHGPGQLLSGTGFKGRLGRPDDTVYSQIRFPLAATPVYASSERHRSRTPVRDIDANAATPGPYPWRDNFCERRAFFVGQCPSGIGHQGQDLRPLRCRPAPGMDRCEQRDDVVAVRSGMIVRSPKQEAAYLFINTPNEHIRFRYLHMSPRKMDADDLLNGRRVHEGEVIGQVSNFSLKENGTSYHLHFDIQVPTKNGWVFVNPYMTLVAAYERLIGERGVELGDPILVAAEISPNVVAVTKPARMTSQRATRPRYRWHNRNKHRDWSGRQHARH